MVAVVAFYTYTCCNMVQHARPCRLRGGPPRDPQTGDATACSIPHEAVHVHAVCFQPVVWASSALYEQSGSSREACSHRKQLVSPATDDSLASQVLVHLIEVIAYHTRRQALLNSTSKLQFVGLSIITVHNLKHIGVTEQLFTE